MQNQTKITQDKFTPNKQQLNPIKQNKQYSHNKIKPTSSNKTNLNKAKSNQTEANLKLT